MNTDSTTTTTETTQWPGTLPERGIYAACLASYNAGRLVGRWIDCDGLTGDEILAEIQSMLEGSPVPNAEEWAIHDYCGIPSSFGENPDLDKIAEWVEMVEEHGEAWAEYVGWAGEHYATPDNFRDSYCGEYESPAHYAEDFHESTGSLSSVPEFLRYHIDWESVARDMRHDGYYFRETGPRTCYVFHNC